MLRMFLLICGVLAYIAPAVTVDSPMPAWPRVRESQRENPVLSDKSFPLSQMCLLAVEGEECIGPLFSRNHTAKVLDTVTVTAFDEVDDSFVPGDKLSGRDMSLILVDSSLYTIPLSGQTKVSYFFSTLSCSVAYSASWRLYNDFDFEGLISNSPSSTVYVFVTDALALSEGNYVNSSCSIEAVTEKLSNLSATTRSAIKLLKPSAAGDKNAEEENDNRLIENWLLSWGTLNHPTVQLILHEYQEEVLIEGDVFYPYYDAEGTTGWSNNSLLSHPSQSCQSFCGTADCDGVCGDVIYVGDACSPFNSSTLSPVTASAVGTHGHVFALAARGTCTFTDKAKYAQAAGYDGLVIFNTASSGKGTMSGSSSEPILIPVIMVDKETGILLLNLLNFTCKSSEAATAATCTHGVELTDTTSAARVGLRMLTRSTTAVATSLDIGEAYMREIGRVWSEDVNQVLAAHAKYLWYRYEIDTARNSHNDMCTPVTILDETLGFGRRTFSLPPALEFAPMASLSAYYTASCRRGNDASCPTWDILYSVFICVGNITTVNVTGVTPSCLEEYPYIEFIRTISSYRKRMGGFIDLTPFLSYFAEVRQQFNYAGSSSAPPFLLKGGGNYIFTLELLFCRDVDTYAPVPSARLDLWSGMDYFDRDYNDRAGNFTYTVPAYASSLQLSGYITGHGWGQEVANCAEFCPHSHHFYVSNKYPGARSDDVQVEASVEFDVAGTDRGCIDQISEGVTANQYGTWYYGRGGWCPGQLIPLVQWTLPLASSSLGSSLSLEWPRHSTRADIGKTYGNTTGPPLVLTSERVVTVAYESLVFGETYIPHPSNYTGGGFGAQMQRMIRINAKAPPPVPPLCHISTNTINANSTNGGSDDAMTVEVNVTWRWGDTSSAPPSAVLIRLYTTSSPEPPPSATPSAFLYYSDVESLHSSEVVASSWQDTGSSSVYHTEVQMNTSTIASSWYLAVEVYALGEVGAGDPCGVYGISTMDPFDDNRDSERSSSYHLVIILSTLFVTVFLLSLIAIGMWKKERGCMQLPHEHDRLRLTSNSNDSTL